MRTTRERIVFLTSACLSGIATMALAAAATSTAPSPAPSPHLSPRHGVDIACAPDRCTRVAKTTPGRSSDLSY